MTIRLQDDISLFIDDNKELINERQTESRPEKTGAAKPTFKYTVADLARKLDASGAETRRRLRALTKAGKLEHSPGTRYGWNDDKSFNEVIALLKAKPEPAPKKPAAKKVSRGSVKK